MRLRSVLTFWCIAASAAFAINPHPTPQPTPEPTPTPSGCPRQKDGPGLGSLVYTLAYTGLPFEEGLEQGSFGLHEHDASPNLFSPSTLFFRHVLTTHLAAPYNLPTLVDSEGQSVAFTIPGGSSVGTPSLSRSTADLRVVKLDATRTPTAATAVFYRFLDPSGSWTEYSCSTGQATRFRSAKGRETVLASIPAETALTIVYVPNAIRQINSAIGLADIVSIPAAEAFEIRLYTAANRGVLNVTTGLRAPTGSPYRVVRFENPNQGVIYTTIKITDTQGTHVQVDYFDYNMDLGSWLLRQGGTNQQRREYKSTTVGPGVNQTTSTTTLRDGTGNVISTVQDIYQSGYAWGTDRIANIKEPGSLSLTTTYDYYTTGPGLTKLKSTVEPDGYWEGYAYDTYNRLVEKTKPWKDATFSMDDTQPRVITTFSYISLDAADTVANEDYRPRTETESVVAAPAAAPIVTKRTFHVFKQDTGKQPIEIEEQAATNAASYGDVGNMRMTRTYFTSDSTQAGYDAVSAGRLRSEDRADGTRSTYSYTRNAADLTAYFTISEIKATTAQPAGVEGLSTRTDRIYDVGGRLARTRSYIYSGATWQATDDEQQVMNDVGQVIATLLNGRQTYGASYNGDQLASTTSEEGIVTTFLYDDLNRVQTKTRKGAPVSGSYAAQPDIVTQFARDVGGLSCGCDASVTTTTTAGSFTRTGVEKKDNVGRVTYSKDEAALETSYSYSLGGRQTTKISPNGGTVVSLNFADRRSHSVTGTGVVAQWSDYGVNSDGSQWTLVNQSSASDPRYLRTTVDLLGRPLKVERPAFDGNTLVTSYSYTSQGWPSRVQVHYVAGATDSALVADTYASYDGFGHVVRAGSDVDGSQTLAQSSTDRMTDSEFVFANLESGWWQIQRTRVYPKNGDSTAILVSETRHRLSGFTTTLASEDVTVDIYGNISREKVDIDPTHLLVTNTSIFSDSSLSAVRISYNGSLVSETTKTVALPIIYGIDALGHITSRKAPRATVADSAVYNATIEQLLSSTDAAGNQTTYTYYPSGSLGAGQVSVVSNGQTTRTAYDLLGRRIYQWGTASYPQAFTYDSYGALATLTTYRSTGAANLDATSWPSLTGGDVTTWSYQPSTGLLLQKRYADSSGPDYTYDNAGRLKVRTWARSVSSTRVTTTYGYDANTGDLLSETYSDGTPAVSFAYDRLARPLTATDASGARTFDYNAALLRQETETLPANLGSRILTRTYQGTGTGLVNGRPSGVQLGVTGNLSGDANIVYAYDAQGRFGSVTSAAGTFSYGYLSNSDLLSNLTGPKVTTTYSYETNRDLLTEIKHVVSGASVARFAYQNDALGRRSNRLQDGSAVGTSSYDRFSYDNQGEVTGSRRYTGTNPANYATDPENTSMARVYSFDAIGNRLTSQDGITAARTYSSNQLNQYTAITNPTASPISDLDGNQTFSGAGWYYDWDGENRMAVARNYATTPVNGSQKLDFTYDYLGRRVGKKVSTYSGTAWVINSDTRFVYDGWNLLAELNGAASYATVRSYTSGLDLSESLQGAGGVGGILAVKMASTSSTYNPLPDGNGNIMVLINSATGSADGVFDYSPFGVVTKSVVAGSATGACPFGFSSKYLDAETGLNYYGFRYYNPSTGRWLSRDPAEEQGGLNLYGFIGNSSVNAIDLLGLVMKPECVKKLADIVAQAGKLAAEFAKYDPIADARGGFKIPGLERQVGNKWYPQRTKPGGHYTEMLQLKRGLWNRLTDFKKTCWDCDDDSTPPKIPVWVWDTAKRNIPAPIVPLNPFENWARNVPEESIPTPTQAFFIGAGGAVVVIGGSAAAAVAAPVVILVEATE